MSKISKREIIRFKLCDLWGKILIKPMSTGDVFKALGFNYNNVGDREKVYRYNSQLQDDAEREWEKFSIEDGDKEFIYRKWLDYCYLNQIPYIIFDNGLAISPKTYEEWEKLLARNCFRHLASCNTSMQRMLKKDMAINGFPLKELLPFYDEFLKLIPEEPETKSTKKMHLIDIDKEILEEIEFDE